MNNDSYRCIIIDDEPKAIALLSDSLRDLYPEMNIVGSYTFWKDALSALRTNNFDIIFLDISMPQKTGMDLLQLVPGLKSEIIFITAFPDHALEAFNFSAAGYILKPVRDAKLIKAVDKAIEHIRFKRLANERESQSVLMQGKIAIPNNKGLDYVDLNDIIFLEATARYTRIIKKDKELLSSYSIGRFKELLEGYSFYQVHRSYIVNLNCIQRYESIGIVIMSDGSEIPVAKNNREEFLSYSNKCKRG